MADNFGLKIGIEGEKEFKKALRDINQDFKVLGSEMKLVASQFDKQDSSIQAVTARNKVLSKEIDEQKEKISLAGCFVLCPRAAQCAAAGGRKKESFRDYPRFCVNLREGVR